MSKTGTLATTLGTLQPFRYRGHIFDEETAIYYLSSRFYNPSIGHFIAVDATDVLTTSLKSLTEKNLYAYCDNNPVMRKDIDGARSVLTSYIINVEVKMMEKEEFLGICDSTLKEMGFSKKEEYIILISVPIWLVLSFSASPILDQFIMSNAELRYEDIMKHSHFPSITMLTYQLVSNFL